MKKIMIYVLLCVGTFFNLIEPRGKLLYPLVTEHSQDNKNNDRYQDWLELEEAGKLFHASGYFEKLSHNSIVHAQAADNLKKEQIICEHNNNCSESEEFKRLFDEYIETNKRLKAVGIEIDSLPAIKKMNGVLDKYKTR